MLVADDNPEIREWLGVALTESGHRVTFATDGVEAMDAVARTHFDVVITDLVMPNRDGFEVISELRKSWPAIRIIAIAGDGRGSRDGYLQWALGLGAHVALPKPFTFAHLTAAMDEALKT